MHYFFNKNDYYLEIYYKCDCKYGNDCNCCCDCEDECDCEFIRDIKVPSFITLDIITSDGFLYEDKDIYDKIYKLANLEYEYTTIIDIMLRRKEIYDDKQLVIEYADDKKIYSSVPVYIRPCDIDADGNIISKEIIDKILTRVKMKVCEKVKQE